MIRVLFILAFYLIIGGICTAFCFNKLDSKSLRKVVYLFFFWPIIVPSVLYAYYQIDKNDEETNYVP